VEKRGINPNCDIIHNTTNGKISEMFHEEQRTRKRKIERERDAILSKRSVSLDLEI
jgi:hypothetical protein